MKRLIALLLCAALLLAGCGTGPAQPTESDAGTLYARAAQELERREALTLTVTIQRDMLAGTDAFTETTDQTIAIRDGAVSVTEQCRSGSQKLTTYETFVDGTAYMAVGGGLAINTNDFRAPMTLEEYLSAYVPAALLDGALYRVEQTDEGFAFTGETLEPWAGALAPEGVEVSASAQVDTNGAITGYTYQAAYTDSGTQVTLRVTTRVSAGPGETITAPEEPEGYAPVESLDPIRILDRSRNLVQQLNEADISGQRQIDSLASGWERTCTYHDTLSGEGEALRGMTDTRMYHYDGINDEVSFDEHYVCRYEDGVGTLEDNDGRSVPRSGINEAWITGSVRDYGLSMLPSRGDLEQARLSDLGGYWLLEYTGTEKAGRTKSNELTAELYLEEKALDEVSTDQFLTVYEGSVLLDKATCLPVLTGLDYEYCFTIEGSDWPLRESSFQTFRYGGGEEADPTPLLYRVTGREGQEMYLFGTIHLGDDRMERLPEELTDALSGCDALAVEFDTEAYEQELAEDQDALEQMIRCCYYEDGSGTLDHLQDLTVFTEARKLLQRLGGGDLLDLGNVKPFLLSQTIEELYLQWSPLSGELGADARLMELARSRDIEIRSIESGLMQMQMLSGLSDGVQELMLKNTIQTGVARYNSEALMLYELWCAGDEAALTAAVRDTWTSDDPTEQALIREYDQAVSTDRNLSMLVAARKYLESGETVFYAVGLAHLLTQDGLVQTLRDAGYTVELVEYQK